MNRHGFISLAGGVPKVPQRSNYHARRMQQKYFWKFFAQRKWRKSVKAVYSEYNVDTLLHKKSYSIEHIIPKSNLRQQLVHSASSKSIIHSALTNPFNYAVSHRKVNASRSSIAYDLDGDRILTPIKSNNVHPLGMDEHGQWVITKRSRGLIARAVIYMSLLYDLNLIGGGPAIEYFPWAACYKVKIWELEYNRWIKRKYNICNPLIENCARLRLDDILNDADIITACKLMTKRYKCYCNENT